MMPVVAMAALIFALAFGIVRANAPHVVRGRRALVFAAIATVALVGVHVLRRGDVALPWPAQIFVLTWLVASALVLVTGLPFAIARAVLALARLVQQKRAAVGAGAPMDLARRRWLQSVLPAAALATAAKGSANGLASFRVVRFDVVIEGLPQELDGFRIGQTTDVHVGPFLQVADLARAVQLLDDEGVDLQVMTGDLLDDIETVDACMDAMGSTKARHGMLCVWGNHEKWRGEAETRAAYARAARKGVVRLLDDEHVLLEHGDARLRVVGVDWPTKGKQRRLAAADRAIAMDASAAQAFAGVGDEVIVCLSHHPDFFPRAADKGAALTLAGHTHGGQFVIFGVPVFGFAYEHMLGRYERSGARGPSHLYVGAGTGHWLPWRFGVPTEIAVITLRARA